MKGESLCLKYNINLIQLVSEIAISDPVLKAPSFMISDELAWVGANREASK